MGNWVPRWKNNITTFTAKHSRKTEVSTVKGKTIEVLEDNIGGKSLVGAMKERKAEEWLLIKGDLRHMLTKSNARSWA